jgi:tetratricopeptide (TPR) repeat protein
MYEMKSRELDVYSFSSELRGCEDEVQRAEVFSKANELESPTEFLSSVAEQILEQGDGDLAIDVLRHALDLEPNCCDTLENLSGVLLLAGRVSEAVDYLKTWVRLDPTSHMALVMLGTVFGSLEKWQDSLDMFSSALEISPEEPAVLVAAAKVALKLNCGEAAFEYFHRAVSLDPHNAAIRYDLGLIYTDSGRIDQAMIAFSDAARIAPEVSEYQFRLAKSLRDLGRHQKALEPAQRAVESEPTSIEMVVNLAAILKELDRPADVASLLSKVDLYSSVEALDLFFTALRTLKRQEDASSGLVEVLKTDPSKPILWSALGTIQVDMGQLAEGEQSFDRAIELAPETGEFHRRKADVHRYSAGDPHLAQMETVAKSLEPWTQDYVALHFALGKAFDDIGDYHSAIKHLNLGNGAKRKVTPYDEQGLVRSLEQIISSFSEPIVPGISTPLNDSNAPVFVVGMPRSGTTLVEQILSSHSAVAGLGELSSFQKGLDEVYQRTLRELRPFSEDDYVELGSNYLQSLASQSGTALRAVDKMPANFYHLGHIVKALPNARIIHVRRDPVDTCISIYSKLFTGVQSFSYDQSELGRYYRYYRRVTDHWRTVVPSGSLLEVSYEAIVEDPELEIRRMIAFLGLPWEDACLQPHKKKSVVVTASAVQVRRPIYKTSVGRRTGYLPYLEPLIDALDGI